MYLFPSFLTCLLTSSYSTPPRIIPYGTRTTPSGNISDIRALPPYYRYPNPVIEMRSAISAHAGLCSTRVPYSYCICTFQLTSHRLLTRQLQKYDAVSGRHLVPRCSNLYLNPCIKASRRLVLVTYKSLGYQTVLAHLQFTFAKTRMKVGLPVPVCSII